MDVLCAFWTRVRTKQCKSIIYRNSTHCYFSLFFFSFSNHPGWKSIAFDHKFTIAASVIVRVHHKWIRDSMRCSGILSPFYLFVSKERARMVSCADDNFSRSLLDYDIQFISMYWSYAHCSVCRASSAFLHFVYRSLCIFVFIFCHSFLRLLLFCCFFFFNCRCFPLRG